ncbi:hypothetical protein CCM_03329 [Cordyceps militaris CM01]|uniref:Uncharacterized protein n=1 Tax=Cordyceps militaris (strain CM01) TaxID=983644 RepID=G3JA37_CORMM|nr:uncharacterized protein CCM_03329 [Cordyceps militaris CM01]EGX95057.1 hypothetical protein CCM_03329 [Cordyceps militaris CM01]
MGNAPSSDEGENPYRRRLSKHQATSNWVHSAAHDDYYGVPTTPRSKRAPHGGSLDDAIPTIPSFAFLQAQSMSTNPPASSPGHSPSAAATGWYKSRPSRHSTVAFHPLRSAPVSGHARAVASMKQDDAPGNDAQNNPTQQQQQQQQQQQLDDCCFSSPPDLSSSSSTESWRTLSSVSDASRELPLYIRRRSLQRIPGLATRPGKGEDIHRPSLRTSLPTSPPLHHPCSPAQDHPAAPSLPTPVLDSDANDLGNSSEVGYKQLGSIKFGSLRITNGSPLSMRRGEGNMDQLAGLEGEIKDNKTSSDDAADSQQISSADPLLPEEPSDLIEKLPTATDPDCPVPEQPLNDMHVSETIRPWQGRFSSETPRPSIETLRHRISSVIEVIDDEQLRMVRRPRSALVTADDSSSIYSENIIPVMISADIAAEYNHLHNDNSNGPHLSFLSFRNLIRQNRVKSYLQANNKPPVPVPETPSHQRSSSKDDASIISTARTLSKSRRKLAKKNLEAALPPELLSSNTDTLHVEAPKPRPPPPPASNDQPSRERVKSHTPSNSDGQLPRISSSKYEKRPVSRMSRQKEHALPNHSNAYQTSSDHVPGLLDRTRSTPRAQVSFEGYPPKKKREATKAQQLEKLRRSQTTEFKPLPNPPKPELPQRRKPVRVPVPIPGSFAPRNHYESSMEPQHNPLRPMPSHVRPHTIPLVAPAYMPHDDDNDDTELRGLFPANDNPYVSPLSDEDDDFWSLTADASLNQRATNPRSAFRPREVSPIRHAKSMSNILSNDDNERHTSTVAPSTHLSRAQELAERWRQQQKKKLQPLQQPRKPLLEQDRVSAFYEPIPPSRPTTASAIDDYYSPPVLFEEERDGSLPPMVYRNGTRRGSEIAPAMWRPPFRVLHSYYSPAYRNAPIWG